MAFDDLLVELGRTMGLGSLRGFDENNVCRLRFGDDLVVDIEHVPARARFYLHAVVGAAPAAGSPLLAEMLGANLFGQGTGDATLAVDPALGDVLLLRGFDEAGSDARGVAAGLELFLAALEDWRGRLLHGGAGANGFAGGEAFARRPGRCGDDHRRLGRERRAPFAVRPPDEGRAHRTCP